MTVGDELYDLAAGPPGPHRRSWIAPWPPDEHVADAWPVAWSTGGSLPLTDCIGPDAEPPASYTFVAHSPDSSLVHLAHANRNLPRTGHPICNDGWQGPSGSMPPWTPDTPHYNPNFVRLCEACWHRHRT